MKRYNLRRTFVLLIALSLILSMLSVTAFANDEKNGVDESTLGTAKLVGEETVYYDTLQKAINAAKSGDTVVLLKDASESISINKNIVLDLGDNTLTSPSADKDVIQVQGKQKTEGVHADIKNGIITGGNHGVYLKMCQEITIENCTIRGNKATKSTKHGGAIYTEAARLNIDNCIFENNQAENGGAIRIGFPNNITIDDKNAYVTISNSTFRNNKASSQGGAISMGVARAGLLDTLRLENCDFDGNSAANEGGAIAAISKSDRLFIQGGSMKNNVSKSQGGAIYSANFGGFSMDGTVVTGNTATNGGAIYVNNVNSKDNPISEEVVSISGSTEITNNKAENGSGGGLYIEKEVTVNVADGAKLYNNTASTMADDVYTSRNCSVRLPEASMMGGDKILSTTGKAITGWYYDGYGVNTGYRWSQTGVLIPPSYKEITENYEEFNLTSEGITEMVALKAAHGKYVKVSYNANTGEGDATEEETYDDGEHLKDTTYTVLGNDTTRFTKDGYTFEGWNTKADGSGDSYNPGEELSLKSPTTFYAQWKKIVEVTLVADAKTATYRGSEYNVNTFDTARCNVANGTIDVNETSAVKLMINGETYTLTGLTVNGTGKDVGVYDVKVEGTPKVADPNGKDVTNRFSISLANAKLTINPKAVTLTSATDSKTYDGTALTNDEVKAEGFVDGEGATYNVTGSQTDVGSSKNTFDYALNEGTLEDNYDITKIEGTLEVTPAPVTPGDSDKPFVKTSDLTNIGLYLALMMAAMIAVVMMVVRRRRA